MQSMTQGCFSVIVRSPCDEAIHLSPCADMDCFAALAMTHSNTSFQGLQCRSSFKESATTDPCRQCDGSAIADCGLAERPRREATVLTTYPAPDGVRCSQSRVVRSFPI